MIGGFIKQYQVGRLCQSEEPILRKADVQRRLLFCFPLSSVRSLHPQTSNITTKPAEHRRNDYSFQRLRANRNSKVYCLRGSIESR